MKVRTGFVSNSSSSSFVVFFPRKPESVEDLKQMLFGDRENYGNPHAWGDDDPTHWPASEVAQTVWNDMANAEPLNKEEIFKEIKSGYFPGYPDWDAFKGEDGQTDWDAREQGIEMAARKAFMDLMVDVKGSGIESPIAYSFEYADEDGRYFSALEHGDLFDNLKHIKISHH